MNVYTPEETTRIEKIKENNDKLSAFFDTERNRWSSTLEPLFKSINIQFSQSNSNIITQTMADSLTYRQVITEQISMYLDKLSKQDVKLKRLIQDKFIFYATGFQIKTSAGEKTMLVDAHVSEEQRNIELIQNYIEFLRSCSKNLESLSYNIKNVIELMNYLK